MIGKIIDIVAMITLAGIFIGIMIAIWMGAIGIKILLSSIVLFAVNCIVYNILQQGQQSQDSERQ